MKGYLTRILDELCRPCAGAWIETHAIEGDLSDSFVAPRTGAWIETMKIDGMMPQGVEPSANTLGLLHRGQVYNAPACAVRSVILSKYEYPPPKGF
ncbi:MAG: hypothetical protein AABZ14_00835 [Candidatus Margulisiibacteriota bacterium]